MANIDDILSNPEGQSYKLDPGLTIAETIRSLKFIETYIVASVKNQRRILQKLTVGDVNEEEIDSYLDVLDESAKQAYLECITRIANAGER